MFLNLSGVSHPFNSLDQLKGLCRDYFLSRLVVQNHENIEFRFEEGEIRIGTIPMGTIEFLKNTILNLISYEGLPLLNPEETYTLIPLTKVTNIPFVFKYIYLVS